MNKKGQLFIISGPSGSGKDTIISTLLKRCKNARVSISATTRAPRKGEVDGTHYFFLSQDSFISKAEQDGFLEHAQYCGHYYGTPRDKVEAWLQEGVDVLLNIEIQGAEIVKKKMPQAVSVFVLPPSIRELRSRLFARKTETKEQAENRLKTAVLEIKHACTYDYVIVNDVLEVAVDALEAIMTASKYTNSNTQDYLKEVLEHVESGNW